MADDKVCPADLRDFTWRHFEHQCALSEQGYDGHPGGTRAVNFLPDGRLVSGGADGGLQVWPAPDRPAEAGPRVPAHTGAVTGLAVLDAGTVATAGADRTVKLWAVGEAALARVIAVPAGVAGLAVVLGRDWPGRATTGRYGCGTPTRASLWPPSPARRTGWQPWP